MAEAFETLCKLCSQPVPPVEPALFRDGAILHLACAIEQALELEARARMAQEEVQRLTEEAGRAIAECRAALRGEAPPAP
jgi:hypothetical protein